MVNRLQSLENTATTSKAVLSMGMRSAVLVGGVCTVMTRVRRSGLLGVDSQPPVSPPPNTYRTLSKCATLSSPRNTKSVALFLLLLLVVVVGCGVDRV